MKKRWPQFVAFLVFTLGALRAGAGTVFYVPIPASESDPNSGISQENTYTTAIDGGNAGGSDRVINGITLYTMTGEGQTLSANNCSLTVLEGAVANGGGAAESVKADGTLSEVVSDMTFNNEANDGSEQEIALDPESLTPGTTYDLRVYISNSSGQNREVNLKFFGDGQPPVETGWFNEDDATTSSGGFKDANQVYYINYRYTWDGDTTPGIAISQRYGRTPFCLYALTNQIVPGEELGTTAAGAGAEAAAGAEAEAAPAESGGLSAGFTAASADDVGVTSDTFYSDETLNSNGEWVDVGGYGKCWRPTKVSADWRPYTNGRWGNCDDCGWTWISDDDWGWCTDHYGRWTHTEDTGWCWAPGTVWSPAWVSWRSGTGPDCSCIGWAPLPPEAGCEIDVGVGNWVDYTCGLGPDAYTFVNVVDFGTDNFSQCGTCLIDRGRYVNIFEQTTNITNISYVNIVNQTNQKYVNIYNGGPDPNWCNTEIRKHGGKEIPQIHVNRYDDPAKIKGGKRSHLEGNTLSVAAPKITPTKNPQHAPKVAATIPRDKVDKGWGGIKDPKVKANLQKKIAQETRGKTPKNAPAKLPRDVASKLAQKPITTGHVKGLPKGAVVQQPGARGGAATQAGARPSRPGESRQKGLAGQPGAPGRPGAGATDPTKGLAAPPKTQGRQAEKPGKRVGQQGRAASPGKAGAATQGGAPAAAQGGVRPGQSIKKAGRAPTGVAGQQGQQQRAPGQQAAKPGMQGKGAQQGQAQRPSQGAKPGGAQGGQRQGVAGLPAGEQKGQRIQQGKAQRPGVTEAQAGAQGATQPRQTKPGPAAQKKEHAARQGPAAQKKEQAARTQEQPRQLQQPQAEQGRKAAQQAGAQQQQAQQRQAEQQQKTRQQQQQQQAEQGRKAAQQAGAQQQQAQQQQAAQQQKQRQAQAQQQQAQQQQAAQQQKQPQQQQAQQQQRQLQQQQAQQQQRQLQQQQAQQQQQRQGGKKGKQTPTPPPY
jgi:hypothetical protein